MFHVFRICEHFSVVDSSIKGFVIYEYDVVIIAVDWRGRNNIVSTIRDDFHLDFEESVEIDFV